jgi:excisionase family DNA binding protein
MMKTKTKKHSVDERVWVARRDAAEMVGCVPEQLLIYANRGQLVTRVIGRRRYFWRRTLDILINYVKELGGYASYVSFNRSDAWYANNQGRAPHWYAEVKQAIEEGLPPEGEVLRVLEVTAVERPVGAVDLNKLYTRAEAAELIGCSRSTICRYIKEGRLREEVVSQRIKRVRPESLAKLAEEVQAKGGFSQFAYGLQYTLRQRQPKVVHPLCKVCKIRLDSPLVPQGEGQKCGWCVADK